MALVALVLLIACGNVAMLIVARNASRQHDFSLRMALGASKRSLFRQLLAESALLMLAGGSVGWIFAVFATRALAVWARIETGLAPDRTVLLFTTAISILATVVFSLAPLRIVARAPVSGNLRTASGTASEGRRAGSVVLVAQVALCCTLLIAAGLLLRTLLNYRNTDLGMRMDGLLVFGIAPQQATSNAERLDFYRNLQDTMRRLPGVESATLMATRLGSGWSTNDEPTVDGVTHPFEQIPLRENRVGADYLRTLGVPILEGRDLKDSDTAASPHVVVVNETFVRKLLPHTNPLGHRLGGFDDPKHDPFTIVGVARDSKYRSVDEAPRAMAYFPYTQLREAPASMQVELRIHGDPLALLPSVERAVHGIDPNLPLEKPMTQSAVFEESYSDQRLFARVSLFFGLLAALLVAIGLYGALAYRVSRRTGEIGVRMALGARREQVLRLMLSEGVRPALIGLVLGLACGAGAAGLIRSMLYGTRPLDLAVFVGAGATLLAVAALSCLVPAWRASRIDPMQALRME
jgi:predicted permease